VNVAIFFITACVRAVTHYEGSLVTSGASVGLDNDTHHGSLGYVQNIGGQAVGILTVVVNKDWTFVGFVQRSIGYELLLEYAVHVVPIDGQQVYAAGWAVYFHP